MALELENLLRENNRVVAKFVPWLHIVGGSGTESSGRRLLTAFHLVQPPIGPDLPSPRGSIRNEDREAVATSLFDHLMGTGQPQGAFHDIVYRLDLPDELCSRAVSQWGDNPRVSVSNFVRWAGRQGNDVLGKLIAAIIEEQPGNVGSGRLIMILTTYRMVPEDRLSELNGLVGGWSS
jgi:hypothetical protein